MGAMLHGLHRNSLVFIALVAPLLALAAPTSMPAGTLRVSAWGSVDVNNNYTIKVQVDEPRTAGVATTHWVAEASIVNAAAVVTLGAREPYLMAASAASTVYASTARQAETVEIEQDIQGVIHRQIHAVVRTAFGQLLHATQNPISGAVTLRPVLGYVGALGPAGQGNVLLSRADNEIQRVAVPSFASQELIPAGLIDIQTYDKIRALQPLDPAAAELAVITKTHLLRVSTGGSAKILESVDFRDPHTVTSPRGTRQFGISSSGMPLWTNDLDAPPAQLLAHGDGVWVLVSTLSGYATLRQHVIHYSFSTHSLDGWGDVFLNPAPGVSNREILDADGAKEVFSRTGKEYQSVLNGEAPQVLGDFLRPAQHSRDFESIMHPRTGMPWLRAPFRPGSVAAATAVTIPAPASRGPSVIVSALPSDPRDWGGRRYDAHILNPVADDDTETARGRAYLRRQLVGTGMADLVAAEMPLPLMLRILNSTPELRLDFITAMEQGRVVAPGVKIDRSGTRPLLVLADPADAKRVTKLPGWLIGIHRARVCVWGLEP